MSDLDARVATLSNSALKIAEAVQNKDVIAARRAKAELEQAIRAELQKPALHEPVTDAEVDAAFSCYRRGAGITPGIGTRALIGNLLESFLQGRAKPAQEFYCNKCGYFGENQTHPSCGYLAVPITKNVQPAQEEITGAVTDAMVEAYLKEQRRTVEESDRLFGRPNVGGLKTGTVQEACRNGLIAAIRASKGGKT